MVIENTYKLSDEIRGMKSLAHVLSISTLFTTVVDSNGISISAFCIISSSNSSFSHIARKHLKLIVSISLNKKFESQTMREFIESRRKLHGQPIEQSRFKLTRQTAFHSIKSIVYKDHCLFSSFLLSEWSKHTESQPPFTCSKIIRKRCRQLIIV